MKTTTIFSNNRGNAILQSLMAVGFVSVIFYAASNLIVSNKKNLLKSSDIIYARLLLHSVTDYLSTGVKQEWCLDGSFVHDKKCDSDFDLKYSKTNVTSLGRIVINESYATWIAKMAVSGLFDKTKVATVIHPPDNTAPNYFKGIILPYMENTIDLTSIGPAHPLREILDSSERADFIKKIKFRFERDNSAALPRYGQEIYLKMIVSLLDKDDEVITIASTGAVSNVSGCSFKGKDIQKCGAYVFSTESLFSTYPRELNSFSLIAPNSLYLTKGLAPVTAGDLELPMLAQRSLAATYKGLNFESPVFVNDNVLIPLPSSPAMIDDDKPYSPVKFLDKVIIGSGKVYAENTSTSVEYSPSVTSANYSGFWSDEPTFGGFNQGVYIDGETDNGLKILSDRKVTTMSAKKMNLCINRNLSLIDIQTANGSELIANISAYADFPKVRVQDIVLSFSKPNPPPLGIKTKYDMVNRFKVQEGFSGGSLLEFKNDKDFFSETIPAHKVSSTSTASDKTMVTPAMASPDVWTDSDGALLVLKNKTLEYTPVDKNLDGEFEFDLGLNAVHMPVANIKVTWDGGKSEFKTYLPLNGEVTIERALNMSKYNFWLLNDINWKINEVTDDLDAFNKKFTNARIHYKLNHSTNNKMDDAVAVTGDPSFEVLKELNDIPDLTWKSNFTSWIVFDSGYAPEKSKFDRRLQRVKEALTKIDANVTSAHTASTTLLNGHKTAKKSKQDEIDLETKNKNDAIIKRDALLLSKKKYEDDYGYIWFGMDTAAKIKERQDKIDDANDNKIPALKVKIKNAKDDIATEEAKATPNLAKIAGWNSDITGWNNDIDNLNNDIKDWEKERDNIKAYADVKSDLAVEIAKIATATTNLTKLAGDMATIDGKIADEQKNVDDFQYQLCILNSCEGGEYFPSKSDTLYFSKSNSLRHVTDSRIKVIHDKGLQAGSNASSLNGFASITFKSEPYIDKETPVANEIPLENFLVFHKVRVLTKNMHLFRENDGSKSNYYTPEITIEGYDLASSREKDHPSILNLVALKQFDRKNVIKLKSKNIAGDYEISTSMLDQVLLNKYNTMVPFGKPTQMANLPTIASPDPVAGGSSWYNFDRDCVEVSENKSIVAIDEAASFKPLTWNQSLTDSSKISWDFATQGAYWDSTNANNPASLLSSSEPMNSVKRDFTFPDEPTFLVRSILHDCVVPNTVKIVTGFYTCQNFIIKPRVTELRIIGTIIVTHSMKIDPTALEHGIYWTNIYHPTAIEILQNLPRPVLKPDLGAVSKCSDIIATTPIWHPAPALESIANYYKCSPLSLKAKANPFSWTMVDPDCGIVSKTSNSVTCKNHIRKINVVELYRRSSL